MPNPAGPPAGTTVALVGAGGIAGVHLQAWLALGADVRVYSHASAARLVAEVGGGTVVDSLEEALDGATIADVVTPTFTHADLVGSAAEAGCQVICEKPLARSVAQAHQMVATCEAAGVRLYPAHVVRFFPEYAAAHAHVAAGGVGTVAVQRFSRAGSRPERDWFADRALSGGIVADQMIHDLDIARWTAGDVTRVFAREVSTPDGEARRGVVSAQVVLTHAGGALSYVTGTWAAPGSEFRTRFEIAGTDGLVHHDSARHAALRIDGGSAGASRGLLPGGSFMESPYLTQLRELALACTGGPEPRVTARDGVEAVRLAEAAAMSLETGRAIDLEDVR